MLIHLNYIILFYEKNITTTKNIILQQQVLTVSQNIILYTENKIVNSIDIIDKTTIGKIWYLFKLIKSQKRIKKKKTFTKYLRKQ